jgi:hypothetical protein
MCPLGLFGSSNEGFEITRTPGDPFPVGLLVVGITCAVSPARATGICPNDSSIHTMHVMKK